MLNNVSCSFLLELRKSIEQKSFSKNLCKKSAEKCTDRIEYSWIFLGYFNETVDILKWSVKHGSFFFSEAYHT